MDRLLLTLRYNKTNLAPPARPRADKTSGRGGRRHRPFVSVVRVNFTKSRSCARVLISSDICRRPLEILMGAFAS